MNRQCPSCKRQIEVPEAALGKKVRCAGCQAVFVIDEEPIVIVPAMLLPAGVDEQVPVVIVEDEVPITIIAPTPAFPAEPMPSIERPPAKMESYMATLARESARRASMWMIVTTVMALARVFLDMGTIFFTYDSNADTQMVMTIPACLFLVLFVPLIALLITGTYALRTLGSRALMMTGAGASFFIGLYGCYGSLPAYRILQMLNDGRIAQGDAQGYLFGLLLFVTVFLLMLALAGLGAGVVALTAVFHLSQANVSDSPGEV